MISRTAIVGLGTAALALGLAWGIYSLGHSHGMAEVQVLWDQQSQRDRAEIDRVKGEIARLEETNRIETTRITHELAEAQRHHAVALADQRAELERRLRGSDARAALYQRQAAAGTAQCRDLGRHAAGLDRSLEEGRSLVADLRRTLGLRDEQLRQLGRQLLADRALIGEAGTPPARMDSPR